MIDKNFFAGSQDTSETQRNEFIVMLTKFEFYMYMYRNYHFVTEWLVLNKINWFYMFTNNIIEKKMFD